jgi:acyl carrier protein
MDRTAVLQRINQVCQNVFRDDSLLVNESTNANDVDGWDSMTNLLLIDAIETEFNITFSLDEILEFNNIGDMYRCIVIKL